MKNKIAYVLFALFGILPALNAQPFYFKHYLVENVLSNKIVSCSIQDKNGFLWFGTINGLNRFDGYSFKVFRHNPEDSSSIGSNFIRCLYEDQKGCLWIGTNKGIYLYNSHSEKFCLFSKALLGDVTDIKEDKEGRIWLISNLNLFCYDHQADIVKPYILDSSLGTASSIAVAANN